MKKCIQTRPAFMRQKIAEIFNDNKLKKNNLLKGKHVGKKLNVLMNKLSLFLFKKSFLINFNTLINEVYWKHISPHA